ncbi:hypothetical protein CIB84_006318, partial [Bambusicola thoracicus]
RGILRPQGGPPAPIPPHRLSPSSQQEKTKKEGKRIVCEFEQLQRFLKEKERFLLVQLADLDRAVTKVQEDAVTKVLEEMSHLDTLMWEMEGKFQQPDSKFLLDIRRLLNSCEMMKFSPPAEISPTLERRLEDFLQKNVLVRLTLQKCQGTEWGRSLLQPLFLKHKPDAVSLFSFSDSLMFQLQEPANVTMDPTTAHPNLHLSEDRKQARGQLVPQDLPENPERFSFEPCVLGCQGFTSGRHFWEVEVGQGGVWALGVARASMKRKGPMSFSPKEGVWALEAYHSLTSPRANLRLNALPRRIRVSLDYEGGRVAFFSSDDDTPILVFTRALFNGEKLEDLKNEIEKRQKSTAKLSEEIPPLDTKAQGEKSQQSDVKSPIARCGKVTFQLPAGASPGPEERLCHFSWRNGALKETLKRLQANITLDPDTAHPDLVLSEDRKSVKRGEGRQDLPDNPERFAYWPFVLGHQSFSSGRHCWEVEVGDEGDWAIGVARESIPRKGQLSLCPKGGIWGVEKWGGQVRALTTHKVTLLALRWVPRRVSVHLDYAGGTVAFFDADEGGLIFVFSHASFAGERVRPWLWVVGVRSKLRLCP